MILKILLYIHGHTNESMFPRKESGSRV